MFVTAKPSSQARRYNNEETSLCCGMPLRSVGGHTNSHGVNVLDSSSYSWRQRNNAKPLVITRRKK